MARGHIKVPEELADFLTIEDCSDFPLDRYLLTPNQKEIAEDILRIQKITKEMRALNLDYINATLLYGVPGTGKAQPMYSKILTEKGYVEMSRIAKGMKVFTPEGNLAEVTGIYPQGVKDVYELEFDDGGICRCTDEHLWDIQGPDERDASKKTGWRRSRIMTLNDIIVGFEENKYCIKNIEPPDFTGNGTYKEISISEYADRLIAGYAEPKIKLLTELPKSFRQELYNELISKTYKKEEDDDLHLMFNTNMMAEFVTSLARSIGLKAKAGIKDVCIYKATDRYIKKITYIGKEPCQCIYINDSKHLYITDDYIVTHNTTFGRYLACKFNIDFAFLNFANLVSGGIMGDTSRNISKVFAFMKDQKCIFMLDELDCISVSRGREKAATGGELARITITVMQELDKYKRQKVNSIIIAATNRIEDVDAALRSRFAIKKEIVAWTNEQKEIYARKFLDGLKIPYDGENVHQYCSRNSTLQQREIEADMIRCIANWIDNGKKDFHLDHIREK